MALALFTGCATSIGRSSLWLSEPFAPGESNAAPPNPLRTADGTQVAETPPAGASPEEIRSPPANVPSTSDVPQPGLPVSDSVRPLALSDAIEQVNRVIDELKHALDDMEEVLETLELAERQKIDDEREIQNLQRALRQLHQRRDHDQRH